MRIDEARADFPLTTMRFYAPPYAPVFSSLLREFRTRRTLLSLLSLNFSINILNYMNSFVNYMQFK